MIIFWLKFPYRELKLNDLTHNNAYFFASVKKQKKSLIVGNLMI
jgi:hypothetical protein